MSHKSTGINDLFKNIIDKPIEILFAHQEKQIIKLFFDIMNDLEKNDELNLSSAQSGYEISDKIKEKGFDIIIIDEELPSFNIPKVFHELRVEHPDSKAIFLAKKFNNNLNNFGRIQYCRKPYRFNYLRNKIAEVLVNPDLCAKNILPIDILNTLSTIKEKSSVVIQNIANNSSGELFIDNKKIVKASVESVSGALEDSDAITEILSWTDFEGCISKGTPFPAEEFYTISVDTSRVYDLDDSTTAECKNIELSKIAKKELQYYLSLVPYSIEDNFVMNAFCSTDCKTHASVKDPEFNETLYKISDRLVETFIEGTQLLKSQNKNRNVVRVNDQFIMALYQLDKNVWYYAILKNDEMVEKLSSYVDGFSNDAIQILNDNQNSAKELAEDIF